MKPQQLRLSEQALGKLTQLALAVELHEKKRFSLRKDMGQVVGLLKVAASSSNNIILEKLADVYDSLSADTLGFFRKLGVTLEVPARASTSQQTYRGQVVKKAPKTVEPEATQASTGKKKIIYRGKVIYR